MITDVQQEQRRRLLSFYREALARVHGKRVVVDYLATHPVEGKWAVIAVGKAASAMAAGTSAQLGERLHRGLVITRHGYAEPLPDSDKWQIMESGHPVPDEMSLLAGEVMLQFLGSLSAGVPLLFLLSGGASALMEALPSGVSFDDLVHVNDWLLASGLEIRQMNAVRQRMSRIKGGRLAHHLHGRRCLQLLLSDVPGDDPAIIGSAPLYPVADSQLPDNLPDWLDTLLQHAGSMPAACNSLFEQIETRIVADNKLALQAVKEAAEAEGAVVYLQAEPFQGQAQELAQHFVETLLQGPPGLYLWGGESSVRLPLHSGIGGRNQHLALAATELLSGRSDILLLAAATDGSDGPGEVAGALIDGGSKLRGEEEGGTLREALDSADSGHFLEASGDLIETGPTGSNVMDLVIGWKWDLG